MDGAHDTLVRKLSEHSRLSAEDVAQIRTLTTRIREFAAGEDIVRQGDRSESSVLVLKGMVARYHTRTGGRRQYLSFHMSGDLPDAQTLFLEWLDHAVCAIDQTAIALIPHKEILRLFARQPGVGFAIWRETLIDAAIFREAITNNSSRPMAARMAHLFCELYYRARAAGLCKRGSCRIPLQQGQLGEALGMSIVTVNRALQGLRATGSMEFRNGELLVRDWKRLAAAGEFDANYLQIKPPRM